MIGKGEFDLAALEAGQSDGRHARHVGILAVDDVDRELDRRLRLLTGARCVAAKRKKAADLYVLLCDRSPGKSHSDCNYTYPYKIFHLSPPATVVSRMAPQLARIVAIFQFVRTASKYAASYPRQNNRIAHHVRDGSFAA